MKVSGVAAFLMMTASVVKKRWIIRRDDEPVDTLTTFNGMVFLGRNQKLQWFTMSEDKIRGVQERWMPRPIQKIVVHPKSLLINLCPETIDYVSDTMVFTRGKTLNVKWYDNTLYETIIDEDRIIRGNHFGQVHIGSLRGNSNETSPMDKHKVKTSTAMTFRHNLLWCASEERTKDGPQTIIEVFNTSDPMLQKLYSFSIDSKTCSHPTHISVVLQECHPRIVLYVAVAYMRGGIHVGHAFFPPDKQSITPIRTHLMPSQNPVLSMCMDYPFVHSLDKEGIETMRFPSILSIPEYIGRYDIPQSNYHIVNQIACLKRRVFWNGHNALHSVEISS